MNVSLILTNPYRILGLQATASRREMTKRIDDLLARVEIGKFKNYPLDCEKDYPLFRNQETINHAIHQLENEENKLFHSLFWFISCDSVDELALECLENGLYDKAGEFWQKQIEKTDTPQASWLINYSTLLLLKSSDSLLFENYIKKAMQLLGQALSTQPLKIKETINLNGEVDVQKIARKVVDSIKEYIEHQSIKSGKRKYNLQSIFQHFPGDALQYLISVETSTPLQKIEEAISYSKNKRGEGNKVEIYNCNALITYKNIIESLIPYADNYRVKSALNAYAEEILDCAIFANNQLDDTELAVRLIQHAIHTPSWDNIRNRIEENKAIIENNLQQQVAQKQYGKIIDFAETQTTSLAHAKIKINVLKDDLDKIAHEDTDFITASSICANIMLDYLVDVFNQASDNYDTNTKPDINKLKNFLATASEVRALTNMLKDFTLTTDARNRVDQNFATVNNVTNQLSELNQKFATHSRSQKSSISSIKTLIGWGIFLFIIISILKK